VRNVSNINISFSQSSSVLVLVPQLRFPNYEDDKWDYLEKTVDVRVNWNWTKLPFPLCKKNIQT